MSLHIMIDIQPSPATVPQHKAHDPASQWAVPAILGLVLSISCQSVRPTTDLESPTTPIVESAPTLNSNPVTLHAYWEPMEGPGAERMTASTVYGHHFDNLTVAETKRTYKASDFSVFLPPEPVQVGDTWPVPKDLAATFLTQFHPNAQAELNMHGSGAYAILRARSEDHWDILFRLHAQFVLAERLFYTPAQFAGRLIIDRDQGDIEHVTFSVPRDHPLNVDLEALIADQSVAMALIPRMELIGGDPAAVKHASWEQEIAVATARNRLSHEFFAFQAIDWVPLEHALNQAREIDKPIFALVIKGVLDDQSC